MFFELWFKNIFIIFYNPETRIYWLYLLTTFIFIIAYSLYFRGLSYTKEKLSYFLSKKFWLNSNTRVDLGLLLINKSLFFFISFFLIKESHLVYQLTLHILKTFRFTFSFHKPILIDTNLNFIWFFTFFHFILLDLFRFIQHLLMHKVPFLWSFHKLHHEATELTPLTLYRIHPLELLFSKFTIILSSAISAALFIFLTDSPISGIDLLGVNIFGFIFNMSLSNLRHSAIPLSFGFFEHLFISPKQHQLHHSNNKVHKDINFGVVFSFWDQLFSTIYYSKKFKDKINYGLIK